MKIKNLTGTADEKCSRCGSWLEHWEKFSRQNAGECGVIGCNRKDVVGAHVRKYGAGDHTPYIYPLCLGCNQSTEVLEVWGGYDLVSPDACE